MGLPAYGTYLKRGNGQGSETFLTVAECIEVDWDGMKLETKDATTHDSPNATRQLMATLKDPGQIKFKLQFMPTNPTHSQSTGIMSDWNNRVLRNFQWVFPDVGVTTWAFSAYVTSFSMKAPVDGKIEADLTLDISGMPTLAG